MALIDWMFDVEPAVRRGDGWWVTVHGSRRWEWGPFDSPDRARAASHAVFQRWRSAARARGGWAWRPTAHRWVVTVPAGCAVDGLPFRSEACTRHTA